MVAGRAFTEGDEKRTDSMIVTKHSLNALGPMRIRSVKGCWTIAW